jgi:hypothetical protein
MTRIPALQESFVKSSTHSSSPDIASPARDISHDHHNLKDVSDDVTTNSDDVRIDMTDDVTNINIDDVSGSESLIVMDNDDVTANKPDDVMSDFANKTDDVMSEFANKTDDVMSDFSNKSDDVISEVTKKNDDVMKNIDDVTDDEIELEDKVNNCNNAPATDLADRPTFKVKQDLRKIRATVEFVDEDVRDIEICEGDLNNSEGEEEERDCELDESNGDDGNIDNSIGDDIDNDIDDNICNDGDHGDYGVCDDDNDSEIEVNWKQVLKDDATVGPFKKRELSKGRWMISVHTRTQVVTNLQRTCSNAVPTTCQQDVFALLVPSLFTSSQRLVDNLLQAY